MTKKEFIATIKRAEVVYASVRLREDEVWYVQVVKKDLLSQVNDNPDTLTFKGRWSCGALYLD